MSRNLWLWLPALLWMGVIFYLSTQTGGPPGPAWLSIVGHVGEYSILSALLWPAIKGTIKTKTVYILALTIGLSTLYGISDEWHQSFVPGRFPDPFDVLVDFFAAAAAAGLLSLISFRRQTIATGQAIDSTLASPE